MLNRVNRRVNAINPAALKYTIHMPKHLWQLVLCYASSSMVTVAFMMYAVQLKAHSQLKLCDIVLHIKAVQALR